MVPDLKNIKEISVCIWENRAVEKNFVPGPGVQRKDVISSQPNNNFIISELEWRANKRSLPDFDPIFLEFKKKTKQGFRAGFGTTCIFLRNQT